MNAITTKLLLISSLLLGLTACTANMNATTSNLPDDTDRTNNLSTDIDETHNGERVEINVFTIFDMYFKPYVEEYNRSQQQVTVKLHGSDLQLSSSDDIVNYLTSKKNMESDLPQLVLAWDDTAAIKDLIEPLDGFIALEPDKWNEDDLLDHLLENNLRFDGVTYGIPLYTRSSALYYNKKLFANAGLQPPTTWDELISAADALSDPAHHIDGVELSSITEAWTLLLWQAGGQFASQDGKQLLFNSDAGVKAAQLLKEQVKEKKSFFLDQINMSDTRFRDGGAAMYIADSFMLSRYTYHPGLDFGIVPLPAGPDGAATMLSSSNNYMIKSTPVKEKAAWDFLMWLSSPEISARVAPGWYSGIPIRKSSFKQQGWLDALKEEPRLQVFADAYPSGKFLPYQTNVGQTLAVLDRNLTAMLDGKQSPQQAIDNSYKESQLNVNSWLDD